MVLKNIRNIWDLRSQPLCSRENELGVAGHFLKHRAFRGRAGESLMLSPGRLSTVEGKDEGRQVRDAKLCLHMPFQAGGGGGEMSKIQEAQKMTRFIIPCGERGLVELSGS